MKKKKKNKKRKDAGEWRGPMFNLLVINRNIYLFILIFFLYKWEYLEVNLLNKRVWHICNLQRKGKSSKDKYVNSGGSMSSICMSLIA